MNIMFLSIFLLESMELNKKNVPAFIMLLSKHLNIPKTCV